MENQNGASNKKNNSYTFLILGVLIVGILSVALYLLLPKNWWQSKQQTAPKSALNKSNIISQTAKVIYDPQKGYVPGFLSDLPLEKPLDISDNSRVTIIYRNDPHNINTASPAPAGVQQEGISPFDPNRKVTAVSSANNSSSPAPENKTADHPPVTYLETTVEYMTDTPMEKSVDAYRNYFKKNKWEITYDGGLETVYSIRGTKPQEFLSYTYSVNSISGKKYIKLVYSQRALSPEEQKMIDELKKTN